MEDRWEGVLFFTIYGHIYAADKMILDMMHINAPVYVVYMHLFELIKA